MSLPISFRLVRLESLFFLTIGQSYLFIGPHIPFALPWRSAPFREFITQPGLEESWPKLMTLLRSIGGIYFLFGIMLYMLANFLSDQQSRQDLYEQKRGRRGTTVHSKIEQIETRVKGGPEIARFPPFWLLVIVHIALAAANQYCYHGQPYGIQFAFWSTTTAAIVHSIFALNLIAAQSAAKQLWKDIEAQKVE